MSGGRSTVGASHTRVCEVEDMDAAPVDQMIVTRELQKVKPDKWGCVQTREIWSPKEHRQV
jgi:hypothetical protein